METLKIEIPKGHVIDSFDINAGVIKFKEKPKNPMERIKTVSDVLADHGLTLDQFNKKCDDDNLTEDERAYRIIKMLVKSLNEGWTPDWSNDNQYKYLPWFYMGGSRGFRSRDYGYVEWAASSDAGSRLCFKSSELAKYAGEQFTDVYKQFMTI